MYNWTFDDGGLYVEPTSDTFITRWDTRLSSPTNELRIYANDVGAEKFTIDWGDGTTQYYANDPGGDLTHTYAEAGVKTVTITGTFPHFNAVCDESEEYNKIIDVVQWGTIQWEYLNFGYCDNLTGFSATDIPNTSSITNMNSIFYSATLFNGPVNDWDVSNVTSMYLMFYGATTFNQRIDGWNISNVTDMSNMLTGTAFAEAKYTRLLNSWSQLSIQPDVYFGTDAMYCGPTAQAARDILTNAPNNWVITDAGATTDCVTEDENDSSGGGTATRIGDRIKSYFATSTGTSTPIVVSVQSFFASVRNLIEYLTKNEAALDNLTPEESTKIIVGLRDILTFLLTLLPGV